MAKVVLRNVRLSFAHVLEPVPKLSGDGEEYNCSLIIEPSNPSLAELEAALKADAVTKFGSKAEAQLGKTLKWPIRDADEEGREYEGYAGNKFINVRSQRPPQIVDRQLMPIIDDSEVYSGCYANVSVSTFAYDAGGSKGVSAGLNNIQVTKKGERLAGAADAADDFDVMDDDADLD